MSQIHKEGGLQVWWVPQVPMPQFTVAVESPREAAKLLRVLAEYDIFQLKHSVKPDFCNAGGLCVWSYNCDGEGNPGWEDWYDEETGDDIDAWAKEHS